MSHPQSDERGGRASSPVVSFNLGNSSMTSPSPLPVRNLGNHIRSPLASGGSARSSRSAFTPVVPSSAPILTPSGRNSSMLLLSPSRTISDTLTELASSTAHQLEEIWDQVGYVAEDRASQLSDLLVRLRDVCESKIAEERNVAVTYRKTIADAKEELKAMSKALKIHVDPHLLRDNEGQTLTDELTTLDAALEGLRTKAAAAKEELDKYRDQLKDGHEALGVNLSEKWLDTESDLTSPRREEFRRKVSAMNEDLSTRTSAIIQLLRDCQHFMKDLRIEDEESMSDLDKRIAGSLVRSKDGSFMMVSKFKTDTCTGISSSALNELTHRVSELDIEKRRRKEKLREIGSSIGRLWEKLHITEAEQRAFSESINGLGLDTIEKGEAELARLTDLKARMLGKLVMEARESIMALWDLTNATKEHRQDCSFMYVHDEALFDDDLLDKHEQLVLTLEARLEQMKPIIRLIERREDILAERMKYEELQRHPERLQQRDADLTKQLMLEEKMARRIKRDLPKLTKLLETKLREWKKDHSEDFQYDGAVYLKLMAKQEDEWIDYKNKLKSQKNQVEQKTVENRFDSRFRALPGKKAAPSTKHRAATTKPLHDARSKENVRAPSRVRPR